MEESRLGHQQVAQRDFGHYGWGGTMKGSSQGWEESSDE